MTTLPTSLRSHPAHLRYVVRLLGGLYVERFTGDEGEVVVVPTGKSSILLAYLLVHPRVRHPRERLGELFWPDAAPERMRRNLSDLLYRLRQVLGDDWFNADPDVIALRTDLCLDVDLWQYEAAIATGERTDLEQAVVLYRGELLPEIYEDWVLVPRVALHESYLDALAKLGQAAESERDLGRALLYYRQLTQADPLREESYLGMMRVLAGQRRLAEALAIYEILVEQLRRELDVPPSEEIQRLAGHLRSEQEVAQHQRGQTTATASPLPFVGRLTERALLLRLVESTLAGHGGLAAVEGEGGMGKSRLLETLAESARWRGMTVVSGRATAFPAPSPLAPLQKVIAAALAPPRAAQIKTELSGEQRAALAELYPAWRGQVPLIGLTGEQARQRFHSALRQLFRALIGISPHLIFLDDVHWAEPALWDALSALVPLAHEQRLLLILAYRRSQLEQNEGWTQIKQWEREGRLQVVNLSPLTTEDVVRLLPPEQAAEAAHLHLVSGGNPFYLQELLHRRDADLDPQTAVAKRIRSLPPQQQDALYVAAVLGTHFPYRWWKATTDFSTEQLDQIGRSLADQALIQPTAEGYAFAHDLIQETVYAQIPAERRRRLHHRVADLLRSEASEDSLRLRAFHLDRAGAAADAARLYQQVGAQERTRHAYAEAQRAFERALALMPGAIAKPRAMLLLDLAQACEITGDRERQKTALDAALGLAHALADEHLEIQVLVQLGNWAARTGAHTEASAHLNRALALAHDLDETGQELEIELILGDLSWRSGDPQQGKIHMETALALARRLGKPVQEGRALDGLAWMLAQTGAHKSEVFACFQEALAVQRRCDDRLGEARTLLNRFSVYQNVGAWDQMLARADEVLAAQRRVSHRLGEAIAHQAVGLAAYALGNDVEAHENVSLARTHFEAVGERLGVVITTDTLGLIAARQGDLPQAEQHLRAALEMAHTLDSALFAAFAGQDLGVFLIEQKRFEEGIALLRPAIDHWRQSGERLNPLKCEAFLGLALLALNERTEAEALAAAGWQTFQDETIGGEEVQTWLWTLSRLCRALGRHQQADDLLRAAYAELQHQAQAIADPRLRGRFFAAVPTNRDIVDACDRLEGRVRQREVTLARVGAPLGRTLTPTEWVTVRWTLHAPEDEAIAGKAERRRAALVRLVEEASDQGGSPTDADLAAALGVSRRTILRDVEALAEQGIELATRARR